MRRRTWVVWEGERKDSVVEREIEGVLTGIRTLREGEMYGTKMNWD